MAKLSVGELLNFAYENFVEEDYSLSKDFCIRALTQEPSNMQAKAFKSYLFKHKRENGRYSNFSNQEIFNYVKDFVTLDNIDKKTIVIDLMIIELKRNGKGEDSKLVVEDINEILNIIKDEKFCNLFSEMIELLEDWSASMELAILMNINKRVAEINAQNLKSDNNDYNNDNYNKTITKKEKFAKYKPPYGINTKPKKTLREKLDIYFWILLPFIILLLPGYLICRFIGKAVDDMVARRKRRK